MTTAVQDAIDWLRKFERMTYNTGFLWMSKEAGAIADKLAAEVKVEILMEGGLIQGVKAPNGVTVRISDYDVEGSTEPKQTDETGHDYIEIIHKGTGEWD
jgi:hypothetical protein